jgi:predicted transcriptional regulator
MIYNHIRTNPGVSFIILKRLFNMNDSTLRYHLNYLEKNKKISFGFETGKRNYYPHMNNSQTTNNPSDIKPNGTFELSGTQENIITTIKKYPGINQKELVNRTGINRLTINRNLKRLVQLCLVRQIPNGNKVNYEYIENEQLRYEILKRLLIKLLKKEIDEETFIDLKRKLD